MSLRGLNVPAGHLLEADLVTWEAHYTDGTWIAEREGRKYREIDRTRLARFALVLPGEVLFELLTPNGEDGSRLLYRRRTCMRPGRGRENVIFLLGWVPDALWLIDLEMNLVRHADGFMPGDVDFDPVPARPHEGEHWQSLVDEYLTRH